MKLPVQAPPVSRDSLGTNSLALNGSVDPSLISINGYIGNIGMHQIVIYARNNGIALNEDTRAVLRGWVSDNIPRPPFNTIADAIDAAYSSTQMSAAH